MYVHTVRPAGRQGGRARAPVGMDPAPYEAESDPSLSLLLCRLSPSLPPGSMESGRPVLYRVSIVRLIEMEKSALNVGAMKSSGRTGGPGLPRRHLGAVRERTHPALLPLAARHLRDPRKLPLPRPDDSDAFSTLLSWSAPGYVTSAPCCGASGSTKNIVFPP